MRLPYRGKKNEINTRCYDVRDVGVCNHQNINRESNLTGLVFFLVPVGEGGFQAKNCDVQNFVGVCVCAQARVCVYVPFKLQTPTLLTLAPVALSSSLSVCPLFFFFSIVYSN